MVAIGSSLLLPALAASEDAVGQPDAPTGSESASDSAAPPDNSPPDDDKQPQESGLKRAGRGAAKVGGRIFGSRSGLKKWLAAGGAVGVGAILLVGLLLFLLASALKIPNLAANITEYEFVRVTRQIGNAVDDVIQQKLAVEAADTTLYEKMISKARGMRDGFDDKIFKQLSPKAALRVLGRNADFDIIYKSPEELSYTDNLLGRRVLKAVKLKGTTYELPTAPSRGFLKSFVPKLLDPDYLKFISDRAALTSQFRPELLGALSAEGVNPIVRFFVAKGYRQAADISLIGWRWSDFTGKVADKARLTLERNFYDRVERLSNRAKLMPDLDTAIDDAFHSIEESVHDPAKEAELVEAIKPENAGLPPEVLPAINKTLGPSVLKDVVSFANPIYGLALPACLIYEGSLDQAGPDVNANLMSEVAAFYALASFADQQKAGVTGHWQENLTAIGAFNDKLPNLSQSNAYLRANGQQIDTSTTNTIAEGGALEPYTLIDVMPLPGGHLTSKQLKDIATGACPYLSDIRVGVAGGVILTVLSVALDIPTGGGATGGEVAAGVTARATVSAAVKDYLVKFARKFVTGDIEKAITTKALVSKAGVLGRQFARDALIIGGLTVAAKLIVSASAGLMNNGLEQGADAANVYDAGANVHAQDVCRAQAGCRPLTCAELDKTNQEDKNYLVAMNQQKSWSDRYIALDSPDSLLNRTATMVYGQFGGISSKPLISIANIITGPLGFGTIFASLTGNAHAADVTNCMNQYYGNVQFGYSADEEARTHSESYLPLQNQSILDQSGKEEEILKKYAPCFGYHFNDAGTSLDPTAENSNLTLDLTGEDENEDGGSMGALLSSGKIVRTTTGDIVEDKGLCSPENLSYNNPLYGDMVFRTRLAAFRNTLATDQLLDLQKVTP